MTREEAKKKIYEQWQEFLEHNLDYAGISEAYKMAIQALGQEFCELEGQDKENYQKALSRMYKPTGINVESLLEPCEGNRLYIKVYADLEPQEKAEKLYQICGTEDELKKVYEELADYCGIEPCEDAISRQAVLDLIEHYNSDGLGSVFYGYEEGVKFADAVNKLSPVNPQELKTGQFAKWVATEIFDDMWEYNKDAFAELACRKLAKIGIVRAKGDEWELVEPQERSER